MRGQQGDEALRLRGRGAGIYRILVINPTPVCFEVSVEVLRRRGDLDEALKQIQEAMEKKLDLGPAYANQATQANLVLALTKEGRILGEDNGVSLGRSEEAVAPLERAFLLADDFVRRDPDDQTSRGRLAMAGITLANILRHSDASRRSISINTHLAILLKSRTIRALDDSRPGPWLARLLTAAVGPFHRGPTCP